MFERGGDSNFISEHYLILSLIDKAINSLSSISSLVTLLASRNNRADTDFGIGGPRRDSQARRVEAATLECGDKSSTVGNGRGRRHLAGGDFSSDIGDFLSRGGGVLRSWFGSSAIKSLSLNFLSRDIGLLHETIEPTPTLASADLGAATDQQVEAATLECGSKSSTVGNGRRRRHLAGGDFSSDIGDFLSRGGGVLRSWFGSVEGGGDG
ncbi:hypothetical protein Dimus_011319 [Dionaea muscipula]